MSLKEKKYEVLVEAANLFVGVYRDLDGFDRLDDYVAVTMTNILELYKEHHDINRPFYTKRDE